MSSRFEENVKSYHNNINGEKIKANLKENGYAVVENVVPAHVCDAYVEQYKEWLDQFGDHFPYNEFSLIFHYRIAHFEPSWKVRLWAKPIFSKIWETEKLLSSMDAVAIGEPPEIGRTNWRKPDSYWFHIDQGSWREGLHAYQGAVYLEETTKEDHCFRIFEKSFKFHKEFYLTFPEAAKKFAGSDFVPLKSEYIDWYKSKGCHEKLVPVPKGGMVLWDSRTIHDNAAPVKGRKNPNKWRFVNFVSMTPAIWAHQDDYITKQKAYKELIASAHWSSQGVYLFPSTSNAVELKDHLKIEAVDKLPDIAQTYQSKLLAGIEKYDFDDGKSNGPNWRPLWLNKGKY